MSLMWKERGITYGTSADKSFEVHPSESAAREPDALSVFWWTDHSQSKFSWLPVAPQSCVLAANPQGTLEKVEVAISQPRLHSPGVLISLPSGRALSGPESSYCMDKWLQHIPFPLEIYLQRVWFQKEGGTPKTSKHFCQCARKQQGRLLWNLCQMGKPFPKNPENLQPHGKKPSLTWRCCEPGSVIWWIA